MYTIKERLNLVLRVFLHCARLHTDADLGTHFCKVCAGWVVLNYVLSAAARAASADKAANLQFPLSREPRQGLWLPRGCLQSKELEC